MGRKSPYAGRAELKDKCHDILNKNNDSIHCDDLLLILNRHGYRIYAFEFEAMLPRLGLTKDEKQIIHRKQKRASHGAQTEDSAPEQTPTQSPAEVN